MIDKLSAMDSVEAKEVLPERLCVFGVNGMSPIYLRFLEAIANFIDVHFFLLNPSKAYWADLPNKRQLAKRIAINEKEKGEEGELFNTVNPLLSALGQQGRDFQQLLLEQCDFEVEYVSFEKHESKTLLANLQNDILHNRIETNTKKGLKADTSISIHACHSRMRETEVLKDQLLKCLEEDPELSIRDIVVMTPDISQYAPYIAAVFEDIPHAIADRNMLDSNDPLSIFLRFLTLSQNRWELESVLDVIDHEVVHQKLGLLESDLENIRVWIAETQIRWGESAEHRAELGFPAFTENSWQAGLERLLMGYANSDDSQFQYSGDMDGILPFAEIEGSQAQALGGLYDFFSLLSHAKKTFSKPHTLSFWFENLGYFAERLLVSDGDFQHHYVALMKLLTELSGFEKIHQQKISLEVILAWFNTQATSQHSGAGFLRGQLTFCSMLPMRAIPFKVIALMGLNEGEYPRVETRAAFDLMANDFRKGDKSPRVDERYQFLEVLLSAQQQLIITYLGQSKNNNSAIPPSVVVSELLEVVSEYYLTDTPLEETLFHTFHSLQAHSRQYFLDSASYGASGEDSDGSDFFSYSSHLLATANALANRQQKDTRHWWKGEISQDSKTVIELQDLLAFYQHPQRHFIQQHMQLVIPSIETRADETEPFLLDGLSHYKIAQEWIERHLAGNTDDQLFYKQLMAQGRWLSGSNGKINFEDHRQDIGAFAEQVKSKAVGNPVDPLLIDITVNNYRIVGNLGHQYEKGNLLYRYAKLKGKDLLPAWISHLLGQSVTQLTEPVKDYETWLLTKDQEWHFKKVSNSQLFLTEIVEHYISNQRKPSPLLIEPAIAWHNQSQKKSARITPLQSSLSAYQGMVAYDPFFQLLYKDTKDEEIIGSEFEEACDLLTPIWQANIWD